MWKKINNHHIQWTSDLWKMSVVFSEKGIAIVTRDIPTTDDKITIRRGNLIPITAKEIVDVVSFTLGTIFQQLAINEGGEEKLNKYVAMGMEIATVDFFQRMGEMLQECLGEK